MVFASCVVVSARRRGLMIKPLKELRQPFEVELKARYHLEEYIEFKRSSGQVDSSSASSTDESARQRRFDTMLAEAEQAFIVGARLFPSSSALHLSTAQFYFYYSQKKALALNALTKVEKANCDLDERYSNHFMATCVYPERAWRRQAGIACRQPIK